MEIRDIPDLSLAECLELVQQQFDIDRIAQQKIDHQSVLDYFRQSERGYRLFHSKEGAMHVGMNCAEQFSVDGYLGQVELIAAEIAALDSADVLEIGCGTGYNTRMLARRFPRTSFTGLDLSEKHVKTAARDSAGQPNLRFQQGNFQQMPFEQDTCDVVFAVESLCQASDIRQATAEVARVLRPGGLFLVIDCYRHQSFESSDADLRLAAVLVEKTMAVEKFAQLEEWTDYCRTIGLQLNTERDLSSSISHNLARFYSLSRRFFKMPRAARSFLKAFPPRLLENSISGLLMPFSVGSGVHRYYLLVLQKSET